MSDQQIIEAVNLGNGTWDVGSSRLLVPQDENVTDFVLARLFDCVQGEGPWRASIEPHTGAIHQLVLYPDGTVSGLDADVPTSLVVLSPPEPTPSPRDVPSLGRRVLLVSLGVLSLAAVAGLVIGLPALTGGHDTEDANSGQGADAAAHKSSVLWTLPEGVAPVAGAGSVVVGTSGADLLGFDGRTGGQAFTAKGIVTDPSLVRAVSGPGVTVVDVGESSGAIVVAGKVKAYTGKGAVLARGPVPVVVGGTAGNRQGFVVKDGSLVEVKAPEPGNSLFGGLPGGGSVWAVAGGKVTYVPATGDPRTIALVSPLPGATVVSWIAVTEKYTVVNWQKDSSTVLAVHDTAPGATGTVALKAPLAQGESAVSENSLVTIATTEAPGAITSSISLAADPLIVSPSPCSEPLLSGGLLWCPGEAGSWKAEDFTVAGRPVAVGNGFVLIKDGDKFVAVPGPDTTQKKE